VSIHLNAFNTIANGVEVLYYDQKALAAKVSAQLAKDIGWKDRGAKPRTDLAVLANTKAPAILIECGFIDNEADMQKWHVDRIANSIVFALTGQTSSGGGTTEPAKQNIVQTGAFGRDHMPDVAGALTSVKMTGKFILQGDGLVYVLSDPTSDVQLKAFTEYLDRKGWWYQVK
ncbi:N-acetylmuramoyl-L-alanine amidase C-terminal domain-containing protein, partial [Bacillus anthracis]|uniref:N-acetylmuramoyl-L-alanine amidase C-terminal domain-containing protein n=1 Tax=Bacillus anthracis TaxID=1392 RepID=UPI000D34E706